MARYPFDDHGVRRGPDGIKRYPALPASLADMLRASVDRNPDGEAVVEVDGPRLSYGQLWDAATRTAGGLRRAGVAPGDRVAIRYGNGVEWVRAFLGTVLAGAVAVPINTRLTESEVAYIVDDSAAATVLGPTGPAPSGEPYVHPAQPGDPAGIFYTSGTTGHPKGAVMSHENFLTNCENGIRVAGLPHWDPALRSLLSVPLFHVAGCNSQLLPTLQLGGTVVIMTGLDVGRLLALIPAERIAVVSSAPAIYWAALNRPEAATTDLSGVRWVTYGGAPIAPTLVQRIMAAFPQARVGNGFGLTETSSLSTFLPHEDAVTHPESVGYPAPTVDLQIADPNADGVGELLIRGANVVSEYWRRPAESVATFHDGWLRTGDLARVDDTGRVYLVDRIKDMINRGGENVYCVEVENVLAAIPGVYEVAVVAVPDEMMGEKVGAVVVIAAGHHLDAADVVAFAREHLADFKVPQYIRVQPDLLVRNAAGKVDKHRLRSPTIWSTQG